MYKPLAAAPVSSPPPQVRAGRPRLAALVAACLVAVAATAATAEAGEEGQSSSLQGTRGILRGDAAEGRGEGAFSLSVAEDLFVAGSLFGASGGDQDLFYRTRLNVVWDPFAHLQVVLGGSFTTNVYSAFYTLTRNQLGSPQLGVKGYLSLSPAWHLGAMAGVTVPTSQTGAALDLGATSPRLTLIGTYRPRPMWQISANITGVYDRSRQLLAGPLSGEQRLAFGIWDTHHAAWTLGVQRELKLLPNLATAVFLEGHQDTPLSASARLAPVRLAAGARAVVGQRARLEMLLAGDARLGGGLGAGAIQPAEPPWQVFAQLTLHLDYGRTVVTPVVLERQAPPLMTSKLACSWDADCAFGRTCQEGECLPPARVETVERPPQRPKTYAVVGVVQDSETHSPVADASVEIKGFHETRLLVDPHTGGFRTWQLPVEEDTEITAFATGYLPTRVRIKPFESRRQIRATFALRPDPQARPVTVRGLLRDRVWGTPVHGTALVTALNRTIKADRTGSFEFTLPGGRYEIVLVAPGYVTQRKQLAGMAGEVVIFNVDMEPFASHRQLP